MKRPISLAIVGVAWFLVGLLGGVGEAVQTHGFRIPGEHFLNLLAGAGLLSYWRLARWYALFVSGAVFIFTLMAAPLALGNLDAMAQQFTAALLQDQHPNETVSLFIIAAVWAGCLFFSGWTFWVLSRRDVRELFSPKFAGAKPVATI